MRDVGDLAARTLTAGVRLTSPDAYAAPDGKGATGLRLCVGSAVNRTVLERALAILKETLRGQVADITHASL